MFCQQVWAVAPQISYTEDHFITDIVLLWPLWAIYHVCHPTLRMLKVGLILSQGYLYPLKRLVHCLVLWTFRSPTMKHRNQSSRVRACVQIEWGETSINRDSIVCRKLYEVQLLYPSVRAAFNIWSQEVFKYSYCYLWLAFRLREEGRIKSKIQSELLEQLIPKAASEPWIFVRDNHFW